MKAKQKQSESEAENVDKIRALIRERDAFEAAAKDYSNDLLRVVTTLRATTAHARELQGALEAERTKNTQLEEKLAKLEPKRKPR